MLRPYIEVVKLVLNSKGFSETPENYETKIKDRIEERLWMFVGLLHKGLTQRKYSREQFYFSDFELAFMTLWSSLNEISELNFYKSQPECVAYDEVKDIEWSNHPDKTKTPIKYLNLPNGAKHFRWVLRENQDEIFIEYEYFLTYGKVNKGPKRIAGLFYLKSEQISPFTLNGDSFQMLSEWNETKVNYERTLYMQIAFILERKKNLSNSVKKKIYQKRLLSLNEIRNHLYLTHADDIRDGFFDSTVREKRDSQKYTLNPAQDIKNLFELIAFLISGEEVTVNLAN